MNFFKAILAGAFVAATALSADAVIALRDVRTVTQPDGSILKIRKVGDEFRHFTVTDEGAVVVERDGVFTFARPDERGRIVSTGVVARNGDVRAATATVDDFIAAGAATVSSRANAMKRSVAQTGMGLASNTFPVRGKVKSIVILVQYSDVKFTLSDAKTYFTDMLTKPGFNQYGGTGSALDFFTENSGGVFTPEFDVYGPITLKNKRSYYGGNDAYYDEDLHPEEMVIEACQQLDATVDFSQYDTNGDGLIDNIFVFYAGQGEASYGPADSVWPHSWDVRAAGTTYRFDGVTLATYGCTNEWQYNRPDGVGTFVHEFSHVMGLPDLYDTAGSLTCTPGSWSALDYGPYNNDGCTPPNYGAYERNALGWADPIVFDGPAKAALPAISEGVFGLIPTGSNNEFFLLENRQQTGWDKYVPGHGMLIWHIDYSKPSVFTGNTVNNTRTHQYVDIEEANGSANSSSTQTEAKYTFPGPTNSTSFTATTTPAMKTWAGKAVDLPITNIAENNGIITFDVAGGVAPVPTPVLIETETGDSHFVASWNPVEGATDYELTVYAVSDGGNGGEETNDFGSGKNVTLPEGWSATRSDGYSSTGNYGASSPSFKFGANGVTLTSPRYDSPVNYIAFWSRGQQANGSTLAIEGLVGSDWVNIATHTPEGLQVAEVVIDNVPAGVYQVRMVYSKSAGNMAIDDIVIRFGTPDEVLEHYNAVSTGGKTSMRVDRLLENRHDYRFTVRATDGEAFSSHAASEAIHINHPTNAVANIAVDAEAAPVYYNLQGIRVDNPTAGDILIRVTGTRSEKILVK